MQTTEQELTVGTEVIRKNQSSGTVTLKPKVGVIERVFTPWGKSYQAARVRWKEGTWHRGRKVDLHSTIRLSTLLPATPENIERARQRCLRRAINLHEKSKRYYIGLAARYEQDGKAERAQWAADIAERESGYAEKLREQLVAAGS